MMFLTTFSAVNDCIFYQCRCGCREATRCTYRFERCRVCICNCEGTFNLHIDWKRGSVKGYIYMYISVNACVYEVCKWSFTWILTTFVEWDIFFRSSTASVLSAVINVDCVVRKTLSFMSLLLVIFLNSIMGNFPFCSCSSIELKKGANVSNNWSCQIEYDSCYLVEFSRC
jgi:hypothetical protein